MLCILITMNLILWMLTGTVFIRASSNQTIHQFLETVKRVVKHNSIYNSKEVVLEINEYIIFALMNTLLINLFQVLIFLSVSLTILVFSYNRWRYFIYTISFFTLRCMLKIHVFF